MSELSPISHPESARLLEENAMLGDELAHLLTEAYDLVHTVKPNLLAIYQTKIGALELRLLQARCATARLKRTLELAQSAINHGKSPDWIAIEGHLDLEFLQWQAKIREAISAIEAAENRMKNLLSPEEDRELKKLYYALVKKLHPDLNPYLSDDQRRLWLRVQTARESGDLDELRALTLLSEKSGGTEINPSSIPRLREEQADLQKYIGAALARIEKIESEPPFTMRKSLEDSSWLNAQREEIERQITEQQKQRDNFEAQLKILLNTHGNGKQFGSN